MSQPSDFKLLVVDDEQDLRESFRDGLKRKGFDVVDASSGNQAFSLVKKDNFDLIVSDIRMDDGTGIDLLDQINADSSLSKKPKIIFVTGFSETSAEEAMAKGALEVLAKPIPRSEVVNSVMKHLGIKN